MSKSHFNHHGLVCWNEQQIDYRNYLTKDITDELKNLFRGINNAWKFIRIEGTSLIPTEFISEDYDDDDIFMCTPTGGLSLSPETTQSSYFFFNEYIQDNKNKVPVCIYQLKKSFRNENKKASGSMQNMRLIEFYQLEYQFIMSEGTKCDYMPFVLDKLPLILTRHNNLAFRVCASDRLPDYSESTMDIELLHNDKHIEVCSISKRKDLDGFLNLEIAIGMDRLLLMQQDNK